MKFKIIYFICIALAAFAIHSCSEMNELHDVWLEDGEIVYGAKVDSVSANGGNERIELELFVVDQRIEIIRIYWNDYVDSLDVVVNNQVDTFVTMLENMEEKGYVFHMVSFDKFGNPSLPFEAVGKVYGSRYQQSLVNRRLSQVNPISPEHLELEWSGIVEGATRCDIVYTNVNGETVILPVPISEQKTVIHDIDMAKGMTYNTVFKPEENAIDEFVTDWVEVELPAEFLISKSTWQVVSLPTDIVGDCWGGSLQNLADDDLSTWYHSGCVGDGTDGIAHHFTMDLGITAVLSKFKLTPRQDCCQGRNPSRFQIWGRQDIDGAETTAPPTDPNWAEDALAKGWVLLLDVETPESWNGSTEDFEVVIPDNLPVKYIRFRVLDTFDGDGLYTALSEFNFWASEFH